MQDCEGGGASDAYFFFWTSLFSRHIILDFSEAAADYEEIAEAEGVASTSSSFLGFDTTLWRGT